MIIVQAQPIDHDALAAKAKAKVPDKPVVHLGRYGVYKMYDNYKPKVHTRSYWYP